MITRNRITWKYFDFECTTVALAASINDIENFEAKQKESGNEHTKIVLELLKGEINTLNEMMRNHNLEDDKTAKGLYKEILKTNLEMAISDYKELESELFGIKEDDKVWPNK
nr:hypothetical protein [uncultured Sulfurimonas sp.]